MRIATNVASLKANNNLKRKNNKRSETIERLSSGKRINQAADDPAGMTITQKMSSQFQGTKQASRNVQDGISLLQTAEGGLKNIHKSLQRMREMAVQASNGTYTSQDRSNLNQEFQGIKEGINDVANNTEFNTQNLLNISATEGTEAVEKTKPVEEWSFDGHSSTVYDVAVDNDGNVYSVGLNETVWIGYNKLYNFFSDMI